MAATLLILATVVMLAGNVVAGWGIPVIVALLPIILPMALAALGFLVWGGLVLAGIKAMDSDGLDALDRLHGKRR